VQTRAQLRRRYGIDFAGHPNDDYILSRPIHPNAQHALHTPGLRHAELCRDQHCPNHSNGKESHAIPHGGGRKTHGCSNSVVTLDGQRERIRRTIDAAVDHGVRRKLG
jgi:hypothetical protein